MQLLENNDLGDGLYVLRFAYDGEAKPGQFFMLKPKDHSKLLGRPISVFSLKEGVLSCVSKTVGGGKENLKT